MEEGARWFYFVVFSLVWVVPVERLPSCHPFVLVEGRRLEEEKGILGWAEGGLLTAGPCLPLLRLY